MYLLSRQKSMCLGSPMFKAFLLHHIANRSGHLPSLSYSAIFLTLAPIYNLSSTETNYCIARA